jgi:ABC-type antimicrobial peptide transport system permease subunit
MALGARTGDVLRLMARQALVPAGLGLVLGLAGALTVTPLLRDHLFGVNASDPTVLAGAAVFLLVVATAASLAPARRAARVDPVVALRQD